MNSITVQLLKEKMDSNEDVVLIDVREEYEHNEFNIGGILIPMNALFENIDRIPTDKPVIFYCAKGIRSSLVIQRLEQKYGYTNLINLSGGIYAWKNIYTN